METASLFQHNITETPTVKATTQDGRYKVGSVDIINLVDICQVYKTNTLFNNLNLNIKDFLCEHGTSSRGQFISILGSSGCGKSTILRYISGLQKPTSGKILIRGEERCSKHVIPMVFQQYSSFPWQTVIENVALPLVMHGLNKKESLDKAADMLKLVGLEGQENKWAKYPLLSGGQLQRVAIARNLVASPNMLLMDEPFGALDIQTRTNMQQILLDLFQRINDATILFVTHDISEAVLLSDRIYIMKSNPGDIKNVVDIDLPRDRTPIIKSEIKFLEHVNYIDELMKN
jgi:NitT/TauT family transport system ATP-binding protein